MFNLLGSIFSTEGLGEYDYLEPTVKFLDEIIVPFSIVMLVAAAVMVIVFSILIVKAEEADRAKEMKKRLIGLMLTVVIITILFWLFGYIISNFGGIMNFIRNDIGLFNFDN